MKKIILILATMATLGCKKIVLSPDAPPFNFPYCIASIGEVGDEVTLHWGDHGFYPIAKKMGLKSAVPKREVRMMPFDRTLFCITVVLPHLEIIHEAPRELPDRFAFTDAELTLKLFNWIRTYTPHPERD